MRPEPAVTPLGLFGGTFDPIHYGHLRLAEEAREALGLARVRFIPAGQPPHRATPMSAARHRLAMVQLAIANNPNFECDPAEAQSSAKSYTIHTLERLRSELGPTRPLVLILGADAFQGLPGWHRWRELLELAHIAVANRPGYAPHGRRWPAALSPELDALCAGRIGMPAEGLAQSPAGRVIPFDMTPLAISASLIRDLFAQGASTRYLAPDAVLDYIAEHQLYR